MAHFIKKTTQLKNDYRNYRKNAFYWGLVVILSIILLIPTKGYSGISLLICGIISSYYTRKAKIFKAGISGEDSFLEEITALPNNYTIINDLHIKFDHKTSQIDYLVIGPTGIFVIEVKNHNGKIYGSKLEKDWIQYKIGRGGTPYHTRLYNPIKQVNTQIYSLSNYLRRHNIYTWIVGIIYFSNNNVEVNITTNNNDVPIYVSNNHGIERLISFIVSYKGNLNNKIEKEKVLKILLS